MSKADRCDICGGFYDRCDNDIINNSIQLVNLNKYDCYRAPAKILDVCPKCMGAIEKLMEELKKEKEND